MDTFLDILNTVNLIIFGAIFTLILSMIISYFISADRVAEKYRPIFCNLSKTVLIGQLESLVDIKDKQIVLKKFYKEVTSISEKISFHPSIPRKCRQLATDYEKVAKLFIPNITNLQKSTYINFNTIAVVINNTFSQKAKENYFHSKYSQRDIVFALQTARDCNEYPYEISRTTAEHLVDVFGGKADSYKKHLSSKLKSYYVGQDDQINKLYMVLNYLTEKDSSLQFDKTKRELEKLRAAPK